MTGADDMDGMDRLSIKADRSGIVVYVPAAMSLNDICCDLDCRILYNISAFQKKGTVWISFRGCTLERGDTEEIISFLNSIDKIHVRFAAKPDIDQYTGSGVRDDGDREPQQAKVSMALPDMTKTHSDNERPYIFRGDIGRKQTLEIRGNVIILGDVARDARVVSGKNIVVVGELAGAAIAGKLAAGNNFIIAMRMCPQLLQIGKAKSTGIRLPGAKRMPMIATNDEGIINITYI